MNRKAQLIADIQNLLNSYEDVQKTSMNPNLFEFMDESSLIHIIESLLDQKEHEKESDLQWLEKFKKNSV